jgi:hypothetical protein
MIACIRERNEDGLQRKKGDGLFQTIGDGAVKGTKAVMKFLEGMNSGESDHEDHGGASDAFGGYA